MHSSSSTGEVSEIDREPVRWAAEFTNPAILQAENERIGRNAWTLLGLTHQLACDGDWIRASLGGRSVFVQRFRDQLAGFENICSHRFYPLKTEPSGNGALRCGLHGWMFNGKGENIGVPMCEEYFGKPVSKIKRPLRLIEIELCGGLVFGRLPALPGDAAPRPDLAAYLGDLAVIIARMTENMAPFGSFDLTIAANWKLCYHMTLEDYHIVAAHPKTFAANGYLQQGSYRYFFRGLHSAMFIRSAGVRENALDWLRDECLRGTLPDMYCVFQIFPNLLISITHEGTVFIGLYTPAAPGKTYHAAWVAQALRADQPRFDADKQKSIVDFIQLTAQEDQVAAEGLQQNVMAMWDKPLLGRQEERIAYFDATYKSFLAD